MRALRVVSIVLVLLFSLIVVCGAKNIDNSSAAFSLQTVLPWEKIPDDIPPNIRTQIVKLYSEKSNERLKAIYNIEKLFITSKDADLTLPYLMEMLKDASSGDINKSGKKLKKPVTLNAVVASVLGRINDKRAVEPLVAALKYKSKKVRYNALSSLISINDNSAVGGLIGALDDEEKEIRLAVIKGLSKFKDPRAVEPLIKVLQADKNIRVRSETVNALSYLSDPKALPALIALLKDKDEDIFLKRASAKAIGAIGDKSAEDPLIEMLSGDQDTEVKREVIKALGAIRSVKATDTLISLLADPKVEATAVMALGYIKDERALEPLIKELKAEHKHFSRVKMSVAWALGELGDKRALSALIGALNDEIVWVRQNAATALGKIGDDRAIGPLTESVSRGEVGIQAVNALESFKSKKAIEALIKLLTEKYVWVTNKKGSYLKEAKLVTQINGSLERLTSRRMNAKLRVPEVWLQWWDKNKDKFEFDKKEPPAGEK